MLDAALFVRFVEGAVGAVLLVVGSGDASKARSWTPLRSSGRHC